MQVNVIFQPTGHKGKIWAVSEEGSGTSIIISLPKLHERQIIYDEKDFNN